LIRPTHKNRHTKGAKPYSEAVLQTEKLKFRRRSIFFNNPLGYGPQEIVCSVRVASHSSAKENFCSSTNSQKHSSRTKLCHSAEYNILNGSLDCGAYILSWSEQLRAMELFGTWGQWMSVCWAVSQFSHQHNNTTHKHALHIQKPTENHGKGKQSISNFIPSKLGLCDNKICRFNLPPFQDSSILQETHHQGTQGITSWN